MYNYNLINPINITYRNPKQNPYTGKNGENEQGTESAAQKPVILDENRGQGRQFPNGNKVQVDYTKNKVNIAQVVEDFKSTIAAINAPKEVSDEVHLYLNLVEAESRKENPSREIILSNLKNASKISDKFIEDSLKKPSTVVEDWVNALFLQHVELKSDPGFINEAFRVQIPDNKQAETPATDTPQPVQNIQNETPKVFDRVSSADDFQNSTLNIYKIPQNKITINEIKPVGQAYNAIEAYSTTGNENLTYSTTAASESPFLEAAVSFTGEGQNISFAESRQIEETKSIETQTISAQSAETTNAVYRLNATVEAPKSQPFTETIRENSSAQTLNTASAEFLSTEPVMAPKITPLRTALSEEEQLARSNFVRAKRIIKENGDPYNALKLYDEALKLVQNSGDDNLKAAIYFERGKVFDDYDYAEYALKDYNNATKCTDNNLKTHAHLKMGRIYDDYVMFDPALEQYSLAIETSEEAKNPAGKTKALRYLAALFADRYDRENTEIFNALSVDAARETGNSKVVAKTLMEAAENFEYIGEDIKALGSYKEAAKMLYELEDFNTLSINYEAASDIMAKLGNEAKAMSLLSKALLYRQKAELQTA